MKIEEIDYRVKMQASYPQKYPRRPVSENYRVTTELLDLVPFMYMGIQHTQCVRHDSSVHGIGRRKG